MEDSIKIYQILNRVLPEEDCVTLFSLRKKGSSLKGVWNKGQGQIGSNPWRNWRICWIGTLEDWLIQLRNYHVAAQPKIRVSWRIRTSLNHHSSGTWKHVALDRTGRYLLPVHRHTRRQARWVRLDFDGGDGEDVDAGNVHVAAGFGRQHEPEDAGTGDWGADDQKPEDAVVRKRVRS